MSRDQNAGQSQNIKNDKSFFERVEEFRYLGTTLTNQNGLKQGDARSIVSAFRFCFRVRH